MKSGKISSYTVKDRSSARDAALVILLCITEENRKSNSILKEFFEEAEADGGKLSVLDRAFTERLVIGTLDRMITLDTVINRFSGRPVRRLKPLIRAVLRLGAYQLMYMDRVPHSAACNESVKLVKLHGMEGLSGFVNGILRGIARELEAGGDKTGVFEKDSERYSVPEWLAEYLKKQYGPERAVRIFEAFLADRPMTVRFNLSRVKGTADDAAAEAEIAGLLKADGAELRKVDIGRIIAESRLPAPEGKLPVVYELVHGLDIAGTEAFRRGLVTVQDPSSALAAAYASAKPGSCVIDVCAAPGGKTIAVADAMGGSGSIDARDLSRAKTELIRENVKRCGFDNISVSIADALGSPADEDSFYRADVLIADLPCSGLGVIAKKPDIKLNIEEYTFGELQELQRDILYNVSRFVKPKGRLVYSTCTLSKAENEENAAWIENVLGFKHRLSGTILPGTDHDGFYIAVFEKKY